MLRCLVSILLMAPIAAQEVTLQVTITAGSTPRRHTPVAAKFAWPAELASALAKIERDAPVPWQGRLTDAAGALTPCEVLAVPASADTPAYGELRTIVAELGPGLELRQRLTLGAERSGADSPFELVRGADVAELKLGARRILRVETAYDPVARANTSKPVWHLFAPDGATLITKGDGGEFPHHRGVFAGWNKTKIGESTYDFWHCRDVVQRHVGFDDHRQVLSAVRGVVANTAHWLDPVSQPLVRDRRTLSCWLPHPDGTAIIDVAIELSADAAVTLEGDPQHAGFQVRLANEVALRKDCTYLRSDGATGAKDDVWSHCQWAMATATIAEQSVAVLHLNHPDNPTPTVYSTRNYGRFGAFCATAMRPGEPLHLRFRLAVIDATKANAARAATLFTDYVSPPTVDIQR